MTRFEHAVRTAISPHRWAETLMDAQIDAARGEAALSDYEQAWLTEHLGQCARCAESYAARQAAVQVMLQAPALRAPDGFAARALAAARADAQPVRPVPARPHFGQWFLGAAAVAAVAAFAVLVGPNKPGSLGPVEVSGTVASMEQAPDFLVRAPSLGAAEIQAKVTRIAHAHEGQVFGTEQALMVRIPRGSLVGMLQDLSRAGEVKVTPQGALQPDRQFVLLRVNLD